MFEIKVRRNIPLNVSTESFPSEEAHARIAPNSWGAQEIELTTISKGQMSTCM